MVLRWKGYPSKISEVRSVVYALRDRYTQLVWSKDKQEQCLDLLSNPRKFLEIMIDGAERQVNVIDEVDKFRGFVNKETDNDNTKTIHFSIVPALRLVPAS